VPFLSQVAVRAKDLDGDVLPLGPDEWLAVGPPDTASALIARFPQAESIVDVSAARTTIAVDGARARDLLAHGCALDLDRRVFPVGRCAQTLLAHVPVILVATDTGFRLMVRSSYARHLAHWLADAATEYVSGVE
jgi:sarcosine oxidase subunit gamma